MPAASGRCPCTRSWIALNPIQNDPRVPLSAEREPEHGIDGAVQAAEPAIALGTERAVVGHPARHERVRELEQDGRTPGEEQHDLPLELRGQGAGAGRPVGESHRAHGARTPGGRRAGQLRAHRATLCVEPVNLVKEFRCFGSASKAGRSAHSTGPW